MKLSHLLADNIRAEREIEIANRRFQKDLDLAPAPSVLPAFRLAGLVTRLLPAR